MQQGIDFQAWIWANFLLGRMHSGGAEFPGVTAIFLIDLPDTMKVKHTCEVLRYKCVPYLSVKLGRSCFPFG